MTLANKVYLTLLISPILCPIIAFLFQTMVGMGVGLLAYVLSGGKAHAGLVWTHVMFFPWCFASKIKSGVGQLAAMYAWLYFLGITLAYTEFGEALTHYLRIRP